MTVKLLNFVLFFNHFLIPKIALNLQFTVSFLKLAKHPLFVRQESLNFELMGNLLRVAVCRVLDDCGLVDYCVVGCVSVLFCDALL